MTFVVTLLCFFLEQNFISGAVFFPLSSVNVSVFSNYLKPPFPPLLELQLLKNVPDELMGYVSSSEQPTFSLVGDNSKDLFYIRENFLHINGQYFSNKLQSPLHNELVYYLQVKGYLGTDGPASMTLTVSIRDTLNCSVENYSQLCFWDSWRLQIAEGLEKFSVLGPLRSPLTSLLCPNLSLKYDYVKGPESDWLLVRRKSNGLEWEMLLNDRLDREKTPFVHADLTCTVNEKDVVEKVVTVRVLDIDDSRPKVKFNVTKFNKTIIQEMEPLAQGFVKDNDDVMTNHITVTVDSPDWPMKVHCNSFLGYNETDILYRRTFQQCVVMSEVTQNLTEDLKFKIVVTDKNLVTGYGSKTETVELTIEAVEPKALPLTDSVYSSKSIILTTSQQWTRVATPLKRELGKFTVDPHTVFDITEEGIVYIKNGKFLKEKTEIRLRVNWTGTQRSDGYQYLLIKVSELQGNCKSNYKMGWCAEFNTAVDCKSHCAKGGGRSSNEGQCYWMNVTAVSGSQYFTCTPNLESCPDRRCDSLEQKFPELCPQDCIKKVTGTGSSDGSGGIVHGEGICYCSLDLGSCVCSIEGLKKYHHKNNPYIVKTKPETCGVSCQVFVGTGLLITCALIGIAICLYRSNQRLKKRCPARSGKEELVNMNYEDNVRCPLQGPVPPARPDYFDAKWEFPRHRLTIEETVGEGEFGMVLKARADGILGHAGPMTVAVKTLKSGAKDCELEDLVSELELLKEVDHPNVIRLLGACTIEDGPLYVIIEYAEHGSLRNYLKNHRQASQHEEKENSCYLESICPVTPRHILTFAWHIAKGMAYLTEMKLVHRDLAARNILLTQDLICKVSDFGLTRDIYEDDTYLKRSKGRVPIKWMALESLADHVYTSKSDVWSYGVLLWELVAMGSSPYPGVAPQNLFNLLQDGYRMERPPGCSIELYALMRACWSNEPAHRPTFAALVSQLDLMLAAGREYLDLGPSAVENRQYMEDSFVNQPWRDQQPADAGLQWQFQGYDKPRGPSTCPPGFCTHTTVRRYENELNIDEGGVFEGGMEQKCEEADSLTFA